MARFGSAQPQPDSFLQQHPCIAQTGEPRHEDATPGSCSNEGDVQELVRKGFSMFKAIRHRTKR